jgi:signal recognition particle receptor subunit beta
MVILRDAGPGELKIVFTGPMGAGKTTAIRALADHGTLSTEVPISDGTATADKQLTTVGFDYGESRLDDGLTLRLFGTPGQERFRFMWSILAQGAFGLVVLVDDSRADPVAEVLHYLRAFAAQVPQRRTVIGVGRMGAAPGPRLQQYVSQLAAAGFEVPVLDVDVRRADDVRLLMSVLVSMAEVIHE